MAFSNLKKHGIRFLKFTPGKRFVHYHAAINRRIKSNVYIKIIFLLLSTILFWIGFVFLFIPGPGIPFILASWVLFSLLSRHVALFFDYCEMKIRGFISRRSR